MKFLVILIFIVGICAAIYLAIIHLKRFDWKAFKIASIFGVILVVLIGVAMYKGSRTPDSWCTTAHVTNSYPPAELVNATDYFEKGNYEYDLGDCKSAIESYSEAIRLNPDYPQSYNNKAYTYLRMNMKRH